MMVIHENLREPIDYRVDFMIVYSTGAGNEKIGDVLNIIAHVDGEFSALDLKNPHFMNLMDNLRGGNNTIAGRGTLVEQIDGSRWFVAWRPFSPVPDFKSSTEFNKDIE